MARIFVPAGRLPVVEDGRLVGLVRPPAHLTPDPTTSKVTDMNDYPTFTGDPTDPAAPAIYRDAEGHVQARPLTVQEQERKAAWVTAAARENADGTFRPANEDAAEAPQRPAEAPAAPAKAKAKPAPAKPDATGVIYVPNKVCRDCGARIERKPGAGRPPAKCLACRAKDAEKAAQKGAGKA